MMSPKPHVSDRIASLRGVDYGAACSLSVVVRVKSTIDVPTRFHWFSLRLVLA